jgi:hypothetical protein
MGYRIKKKLKHIIYICLFVELKTKKQESIKVQRYIEF